MRQIKANAKINLYLRVVGRRDDGYHELEMVNVSVSLCDMISWEPAEQNCLIVDGELPTNQLESVPSDETNIVLKAWAEISRRSKAPTERRFHLEKRIPVGAGLAGGSTDAAAVLRASELDRETQFEIAREIGADVPYCLYGRPALVREIGEVIEPVTVPAKLALLLVNPAESISTAAVFNAWAATKHSSPPVAPLIRSLESGDLPGIAAGIHNDLEAVTTALSPEVRLCLDAVRNTGPAAAWMTGSGSTIVGLYATHNDAAEADEELSKRYWTKCVNPVV